MLCWLFSEPLAVGVEAPEFSLPDQDGRTVTLRELRGQNVVLIFYPGDETPVCRKQLCEFRDHWAEAQARNTLVFGVNPQSARSHAAFHERHRFPFPLLVDEGRRVAALYHAKGLVVKRTVYVVRPDGIIRYAKRGKPSAEEVLGAV